MGRQNFVGGRAYYSPSYLRQAPKLHCTGCGAGSSTRESLEHRIQCSENNVIVIFGPKCVEAAMEWKINYREKDETKWRGGMDPDVMFEIQKEYRRRASFEGEAQKDQHHDSLADFIDRYQSKGPEMAMCGHCGEDAPLLGRTCPTCGYDPGARRELCARCKGIRAKTVTCKQCDRQGVVEPVFLECRDAQLAARLAGK